jgi:hypothetical protein
VAERDDSLRRLELPSLEGLPTDYVLTKVTDRPTTEFTWQGGHRKRLTIYGHPSHFSSELPEPLSRIYLMLVQYRHPRARPWLPTLEIMLSPRAQPGATVPWPAGWPTLRRPGTRARGNSYSLFIDGARLGELKALLASLRSQQAGVMLDDKSWSVAARVPFPSEEQWMRASW